MSVGAVAEPSNTVPGSDELPEGWAAVRLGDVCEKPQYGWTTSADHNVSGVKLLRTSDISRGTIDWSSVPACRKIPADFEKYALHTGDIVISRAGSVGLSALIDDCPPAVFASYLIRFKPKAPIPPDFLALSLRTPEYWAAISEQSAGIAIPNVNASKLRKLPLPLPPLAEQRRIVAKVEELLGRVNAARKRLASVPVLMKRFRQSVLAAACSGSLTADWRAGHPTGESAHEMLQEILTKRVSLLPKRGSEPKPPQDSPLQEVPPGWAVASIEQLTQLVTSGSRGWAKYYSDEGPLFVRAQNLNTDQLCVEDAAHVQPPDDAEGRRTRIRAGDLLVTITGANVTKAALVEVDIGEAYISQHVGLLRPVDAHLAPFVFLWTISPAHGRAKLLNDAYGAGKPGLGLGNLREMAVALPSLREQREITSRVAAFFAVADAIEARVNAATARAERLTQSILAKAFGGELVPTEADLARREGRDYEPASVLLERVGKEEKERPGPRRRRAKADR